MINTILMPVDGSANSFTAVDYGAYLAPKLEASLTGLHVIDVNLLQGPMMTDMSATAEMPSCDVFFEEIETSLQEKADDILKNFRDRCKTAGVSCLAKKNIGAIKSAIIEEAETSDLVVMAKNGKRFHLKEGGMIGSVTEVVIRRSGKPVMVIPESFQKIKSIGMAYDGSASAREALQLTLNVSKQTKWPVTVVIISADTAKAADLSAQVKSIAQEGLAGCEVIISSGKEADEILKFIRAGSIELMAMGAYGHNRLRELILGSTTSQIIQKSPIPILLVRDPFKIRKRSVKR
jgi:nucleotide-binding universal stress UspA family protein